MSLLLFLKSSGASAASITGSGQIASGEAIGQPAISPVVSGSGIATAESVGQPSISVAIESAGIGSQEAVGQPDVGAVIASLGIESGESFGQPEISTWHEIVLAGIPSEESVGSPTVSVVAQPVSDEAFGGVVHRGRPQFVGPPTQKQIDAERIRLGIVEAKAEKKAILAKAKAVANGSPTRHELRTYAYLIQEEIARLEAEYAILKAQLEARGERIRTAAVAELVRLQLQAEMEMAMIEEADIAFVIAMMAEI